MTPATIIRDAQSDGVRLALSSTGTIKATGDGVAVNRWLAVIRERKAEIIDVLKIGAGGGGDRKSDQVANLHLDTVVTGTRTAPVTMLPLAPLTASEETAIRAWLALIEETDPATIADVIDQCQRDADARDYFTGRAAAELPKPDPFADDRRTCNQCANLIARQCQAAKRGEIVASLNYEPIRDLPRRCEGYAPNTATHDAKPSRDSRCTPQ